MKFLSLQASLVALAVVSGPAGVGAAMAEAPAPIVLAQAESTGSDVAAFLQSVKPAAQLSDKDLRRQVKQAVQLSKADGISKEQRKALREVIREGRAALKEKDSTGSEQASGGASSGGQSQPQPQPQPQKPQKPQPQPGKLDPVQEQQAQALLKDSADVSAMKQAELRKRLTTMRDLLASGQLSPKTAEALRARLAAERQVLRKQVAGNAGSSEAPKPQGGGSSGFTPPKQNGGGKGGSGAKGPDIDITIVLGDTRPPNVLRDDELVRRIDVYRVAAYDPRYAEIERMRWRRQMELDRRILRERMLAERRMREARLRSGIDIDIGIVITNDYTPARRPPPYVFAAEAEDEELVDVLSAPPRRQIDRRYTVDEFENSDEARDAVARIEIDTVNFGFGEAFLREEEIDKLDRIAGILERILATNPDEVFLLEGHTDAVGSDAANLRLSRERARAVKEALTTYYVIPAENLETVGLGERYLKIPTDQPEVENRRVSLARITPLVGEVR